MTLPEDWTREEIRGYGIVLEWLGHGCVTVDEDRRGFALGMCPVRERGDYTGKGWRERLYAAAINALQDVFLKTKEGSSHDHRC